MAIAKVVSDILNNDLSRAVVAVILVGGTIGLLAMRIDVPNALWSLDGMAVGFFFGVGVGKSAR